METPIFYLRGPGMMQDVVRAARVFVKGEIVTHRGKDWTVSCVHWMSSDAQDPSAHFVAHVSLYCPDDHVEKPPLGPVREFN